MIECLTTHLTQRALDERRPAPRTVRFVAAWHPPTRRMLDELDGVEATLRAGVPGELAPPASNPASPSAPEAPAVIASHPNPAWWQHPAARLAWPVAAAAALGLAWWLGAFSPANPTHPEPPPLVDGSVAPSNSGTNATDATTVTVSLPNLDELPLALNAWQTRWSGWTVPRPPAFDPASAQASVSDGVLRLGRELEAPLRTEWSRLVADVSSALDRFDPAVTPDAAPEPAEQQSHATPRTTVQA